MSLFGKNPFMSASRSPERPVEKLSQKPPEKKPEPKPGILGEKGYRAFSQIRQEIRKPEFYKNIPGLSKKLTQKERVGLIGDLQKYSGQSFGLSEQKYDLAIKKMQKEKIQASYKRDYKKMKEMDQKIKQVKAWKKG